ncbi:MAG: hypothetical protein E7458_08550 [Ruminococcaceae bacterium]|nr:hypothetical protein [Oscillospiraceae bacterium]
MVWKKSLPWIGMAAAALLCFALGFLIPVAAEEEAVDPMQFLAEVVNTETLTLRRSGGETIPEEYPVHDEALREKLETELETVLKSAAEIDRSDYPQLAGGQAYSICYERCPGAPAVITVIEHNRHMYLAINYDRYYAFRDENAIAEFYALWEALDCPIEEAGTRR